MPFHCRDNVADFHGLGGEMDLAGYSVPTLLPNRPAYVLRPSKGVIAIFASSMPSMQLTFSATTSVPSGLLPRANTSTPQSTQS